MFLIFVIREMSKQLIWFPKVADIVILIPESNKILEKSITTQSVSPFGP